MSAANKIVTAALLVIGDEILSGRTKDKNIGFTADYLTALGIDLKEVRVVSDDEPRSSPRSTHCARLTITCSLPAASGRRMTTSPPIAWRRRSACRSICIRRRWRF